LLDLDETLVHYRAVNSSKGEFLLRPFLFEFLQKLEPLFEVGIFTCALKDYADIIIEHMPAVTIRLYRQHTVKMGRELVKDLSRVGRDLSRVILVDNLEKNFQLQK
jgi:TFIIF-interacting CTD phosphatase-like protein